MNACQKIIEPAQTDCAVLIIVNHKKDTTVYFCLQYRILNTMRLQDKYISLPIEKCIDSLSDGTIYLLAWHLHKLSMFDINSRKYVSKVPNKILKIAPVPLSTDFSSSPLVPDFSDLWSYCLGFRAPQKGYEKKCTVTLGIQKNIWSYTFTVKGLQALDNHTDLMQYVLNFLFLYFELQIWREKFEFFTN